MASDRITFTSTQLLLQENLFEVQRQYNDKVMPATTGKKINYLSDSPTTTSRVMSLRNQVRTNDQYQSNLTLARLNLNFADNRLSQADTTMMKVREIVLRANDASVSGSMLNQLGEQIDDLKTELLTYANATLDGKYIFSGTAITTQPFSGTPTAFAGNSNALYIQATSTLRVQVNLDGNSIFSGSGGGVDIFDVLDDLKTDVQAGNAANIATDLTRLDTGLTQVRNARSDIGIRMQQIEVNETALSESRVQILSDLSLLQDVEIDKAISELVTRETALRLVFSTTSRVLGVISGLPLGQ
ncbi:MAG: flagellar hook-associated protein FlgL [Deltaproteobacteria bacterium]|nr:flagellar hook-associated protein FlgL [Deltaproteobacteria bacterium]